MEKFILVWILFLIFAMLHCVKKKKKGRTAFGWQQDPTAVSWCLMLKISETIPLFWKQIGIQIPEKVVFVLVFMCFHYVVFYLLVKWHYNPECTGSRTPSPKSLANNGLEVIIKETNSMPLILKISVSNSSYLGRSTAAENCKFSRINSKLR